MDSSYGNSFGSVSSSDILLNNPKPKNKMAIFAGIFIGVLFLVAIVFLIINLFSNKTSAIQRYRNYVIAGDENAQNVEASLENNEIWLKQMYYGISDLDWSTFYDKTNSLLDSIKSNDEGITKKIEEQKTLLKMFDFDKKIMRARTSYFVNLYLDSGDNNSILSSISDFEESSNGYLKEYFGSLTSIANLSKEYVDYSAALGCSEPAITQLGNDCRYAEGEYNVIDVELGSRDDAEVYLEDIKYVLNELFTEKQSTDSLMLYSLDYFVDDVNGLLNGSDKENNSEE